MKIKIKKGLKRYDRYLKQLCARPIGDSSPVAVNVALCAVTPDDFTGIKPKLDVREGDVVAVGAPLFHDKTRTEIIVASPLSGVVKSIVRGERRHIERIVIEPADAKPTALPADDAKLPLATRLAHSGLLAMMRQRPFDVVPDPAVRPRDIFVTAFDTAPLAPCLSRYITDKSLLDKGVEVLRQLTDGQVYISYDSSYTHGDVSGATMVEVEGVHPAGNAGVQAANISPVNKGETIWTLDLVTLAKIGRYFTDGVYDATTLVWLAGPEVSEPAVISTTYGADIASVVTPRLVKADHHQRIISGNVFTGTAVAADDFLRAPYRQVTVIAEGDDVVEFMGWAPWLPIRGGVDARLHGGRRAMIFSGEYDKAFPFDILPEYLLKAIISRNFEAMERLGIYEVAPEDFAVCEYADTSKLPLQQIVRDGLDFMIENS
ncbi:MAG: NADH:ubiquinone reductase (Na(+)-transporting) subunit A [Muribaculaceae bacterium]